MIKFFEFLIPSLFENSLFNNVSLIKEIIKWLKDGALEAKAAMRDHEGWEIFHKIYFNKSTIIYKNLAMI